jgi:hypothetical protein
MERATNRMQGAAERLRGAAARLQTANQKMESPDPLVSVLLAGVMLSVINQY